ncbi:MAG: hypothetical protein JWP63_4313 [Candidatus Solibacter sp.]|jgi:hypothetical protein|nr:hypothetical protein [Candidatus Solibacter sp.]
MQVIRQQSTMKSELSVLYKRQDRLVSLIQCMEQYQLCIVPSKARTPGRNTAGRPRCHRAK